MKYQGTDIGLLLVRVGLSIVFMAHGLDNVLDGFIFVGIVELVSGAAMLLGVGASWAGVLMAADMLGVITISDASNGFGGWEIELVLFLSSLAIAFAGAGKYAIFSDSKKQ